MTPHPAWRTRPDCLTEGCSVQQAKRRAHCSDHDPERCSAMLRDYRQRARCRMLSIEGSDLCRRHQPRRTP